MQIRITDLRENVHIYGDTPELPIPRIGERIYCEYSPAPKVTDVLYFFPDTIVIKIDGYFPTSQ